MNMPRPDWKLKAEHLENEVERLRAEVGRLQAICKTIASGLRGKYATRDDMAKLADSAALEGKE